jgi:hypothetical protein
VVNEIAAAFLAALAIRAAPQAVAASPASASPRDTSSVAAAPRDPAVRWEFDSGG